MAKYFYDKVAILHRVRFRPTISTPDSETVNIINNKVKAWWKFCFDIYETALQKLSRMAGN